MKKMKKDEKLEFIEKMEGKINEFYVKEFKRSVTPKSVRDMSVEEFKREQELLEILNMTRDFVKAVSIDVIEVREIVEENNRLIKELKGNKKQ